ncbi:hypothetical protein CRG98_036613 [Punica granatum]|uniref:Uncharacterized protein n=1 Tax=Punica granatum TaxID=22663 RepID=A0A2I0IG85_PUNGR|nr:hypothetical protein CRG98_036613 [Punica granatum]
MGDPARSGPRSVQRSAQTCYLPVLAHYACTSLSQLALKLPVINEFCTNIHKFAAESISLCSNDLHLCVHALLRLSSLRLECLPAVSAASVVCVTDEQTMGCKEVRGRY